MAEDYYKTLGIERTANSDEIAKSYRKLARKFHPDLNPEDEKAKERFKRIQAAYDTLSDPEKRKRYDQFGADWQHGPAPQAGGGFARQAGGFRPGRAGQPSEEEFSFGGTGFSDFFEQMFGGRRARGGFEDMPQRGQDVEADIMVTLEEALNGSTRQISFRRGNSKKLETYTVKIPKGIRDGQRVRLAGQGGTGAGGAGAGDLFLRVKFQRHPDFEIEGANLVYDLEIPAWDAVLGCSVTVPTLDGRVKLKIPAGTQTGKKFRLPGMGLPEGASKRGDLYAVVGISVPENPSPEEKALWEKIEALNRK
jgi:curved DNA-binding protein